MKKLFRIFSISILFYFANISFSQADIKVRYGYSNGFTDGFEAGKKAKKELLKQNEIVFLINMFIFSLLAYWSGKDQN